MDVGARLGYGAIIDIDSVSGLEKSGRGVDRRDVEE